ncbi:hypothetical protein MLD38_019286 [Melastoma candidum]|uniref:Uncharacterized protein n=1 Tax=Melastoma candidum TaxID=119954 RepID=A0ACB9QWL9_9MYRT|nr:hypothetical protein MLD38_019286 [Melastoma candidum]
MSIGEGVLDFFELEWFYGNVLSFSKARPADDGRNVVDKEVPRQAVSVPDQHLIFEDGKKTAEIVEDPGSLVVFMAEPVEAKTEDGKSMSRRRKPRPRKTKRKTRSSGRVLLDRELEYGRRGLVTGDASCGMPLLSDVMAMREHLKSWDHVVALAYSV